MTVLNKIIVIIIPSIFIKNLKNQMKNAWNIKLKLGN